MKNILPAAFIAMLSLGCASISGIATKTDSAGNNQKKFIAADPGVSEAAGGKSGDAKKDAYGNPIELYDLPFRSVDSFDDFENLVFREVRVDGMLCDILAELDGVTAVLVNGKDFYTTLNIRNLDSGLRTLRKAEGATIAVRNKNDFQEWKKFLGKARMKRNRAREKRNRPIRVLPPKD